MCTVFKILTLNKYKIKHMLKFSLHWGHSLHFPWPTTLKKPGAHGTGGTIGLVPLVHSWPPGHGEHEAEFL